MRTAMLPDGARVSYAIYGDPDGLPVLALHGAPACRLMFATADAKAKALGLQLICPDRPGYADSTSDGARPSLAARTQWLAAFAGMLGHETFAVLGISGGSPYAVSLAAHLGARVTGLALVSPMGPAADYAASGQRGRAPMPFLQRRFFLHLGQRLWLTRPGAAVMASIARRSPGLLLLSGSKLAGRGDAVTLRKAHVRAGLAKMTAEAFRNGGEGGAADLYVYGQPWLIDYAAITAPCTLWQGTADKIVPVAASRYLAHQLPRCRFIELPGAGHFWVIDHIEEVLQEVARLARPGT